MSIKYDLYKVKDVNNSENDGLLRAKAVSHGTISTDRLAKYVSDVNGFGEAQTKGTLLALENAIFYYLGQGYNVQLGNLGYLSISLTSRLVKNKNELRSESVFIKRIKFRMSSAVKRLFIPVIERNTIPRRPSSDMAMEKKAGLLKAYLQKNTCIMRAEYCRITDTLKHKAVDDLNMFIEAGWLRKYGKGRTVVYLLNHDGIEKTKDSQATADH